MFIRLSFKAKFSDEYVTRNTQIFKAMSLNKKKNHYIAYKS